MDYRVKNLDGLRGLAILMVLAHHSNYIFMLFQGNQDIVLNNIAKALSFGALGVNLFFLISGFVIFKSLENNSNLIFLKKRWLRLFPSMLAISLFIILFTFDLDFQNRSVNNSSYLNILPGILFLEPLLLNKLFNIEVTSLSLVFWSIYVEVKFYLFIFIFYYFFKSKSRHLIGICYLLHLIFKYLDIFFPDQKLFIFLIEQSRNFSFAYFSWFASGIYFYYFLKKRNKFDFLLFIFFSILSSVHTGKIVNLDSILFCLLIISIFVFSFLNNLLNRLFSNYILLFFGFISYPLYLLHEGFIYTFMIRFKFLFNETSIYINFFSSILFLMIITYLFTLFVEKKFYLFSYKYR